MLIRAILENVYSFNDQVEFNTIANNRLNTLNNHIYDFSNINLLKTSVFYGKNSAGKSNLVKSLQLLKDIINDEDELSILAKPFKLTKKKKDQLIAIEFLHNEKAYYYGIKFNSKLICTEELYFSGLGKEPDQLIIERTTSRKKTTSLNFNKEFFTKEESIILDNISLDKFIPFNKSIINSLISFKMGTFEIIDSVNQWFNDNLIIITPNLIPTAMALGLHYDKEFFKFANNLISRLSLGISKIKLESINLEKYYGKDNENEAKRIIGEIERSDGKFKMLRTSDDNEITVFKINNEYRVLYIQLIHESENGGEVAFNINEESDGTRRLIEFIPAIWSVLNKKNTFIIDEIERSIHPTLIKKLIKKFTQDKKTKGQLIFTTHETTLLDQNMFRTDEIWFVNKDKTDGYSSLSSLDSFKTHKTANIEKGYLRGRYQSVPLLHDFEKYNWTENAN